MKNAPIKVPLKKIPATNESAAIIDQLKLFPHPEGGWYSEVYRSDEILHISSLPGRYKSPHCYSTSIYFMLENADFSAFHRISSDETWHFYLGSPVIIYCIFPDGSTTQIVIGNNLAQGQNPQYTIRRNCWFAAKNREDASFSLVGCTVAPGFEFTDFVLGQRQNLTDLYPQHAILISELTRL
jgi:predicted cupin superfamily sugar epimerase